MQLHARLSDHTWHHQRLRICSCTYRDRPLHCWHAHTTIRALASARFAASAAPPFEIQQHYLFSNTRVQMTHSMLCARLLAVGEPIVMQDSC